MLDASSASPSYPTPTSPPRTAQHAAGRPLAESFDRPRELATAAMSYEGPPDSREQHGNYDRPSDTADAGRDRPPDSARRDVTDHAGPTNAAPSPSRPSSRDAGWPAQPLYASEQPVAHLPSRPPPHASPVARHPLGLPQRPDAPRSPSAAYYANANNKYATLSPKREMPPSPRFAMYNDVKQAQSPLPSPKLEQGPPTRPRSPHRMLSHVKREASVSTAPSPQPVASTSGSASPSDRTSRSPTRDTGDDDGDLKPVKQDSPEDDMDMDTDMDISDSPRKSSSGGRPRPKKEKKPTLEPQLIPDLPVAENDALETYVDIPECTYASKNLGNLPHYDVDSTRCDCQHWPNDPEAPCGDDSACVNRLMQIECLMDSCRCGARCENQRFQRKEYAPIDIVKTPKKGFGVRAKQNLTADTFIYEYVGEVIGPDAFQRRIKQYAATGIKHFYFMALDREVFIDATKKGGKGRFLNHSCNPNCVVAKWTIGRKMHMGIFAKRNIKKDEELTFNYNVDRYGYEAQECYCGEPNCVGYIGGKTQTDIGGMDELYLDALGIAEEVEALGLRGTKKKKGRKLDEDFMPDLKPIRMDEVPKVSAAVRQATQTRRILHKLLTRMQLTTDLDVRKALLRLHGFNSMNAIFKEYPDDNEIIVLDLEILSGWELQQRNKVESSGIEEPVKRCAASDDETIKSLAQKLLDYWDSLEMGYRIPKSIREAGDDGDRKRAAEYSIDQIFKRAKTDAILSENDPSLHRPEFVKPEAAAPRAPSPTLPPGWRQHRDEQGKIYFVNMLTQERQLMFPSAPAAVAVQRAKVAQATPVDVNDVIARATAEAEALAAAKEAARLEEEERLAKEVAARRKDRRKSSSGRAGSGSGAEPSMSGKDKKVMSLFSTVVVQVMSKYREHFDSEQFKKRAREVTLLLCEKEKKHPMYATDSYDKLSAEKTTKVKAFTKDWTKKLIERKKLGAGAAGSGVATPNGKGSSGHQFGGPSPSTPGASMSSTPFTLAGPSPSMTPTTPLVAPRDVKPIEAVGQGLSASDRSVVRDIIDGVAASSHQAPQDWKPPY